MTKRVTVFIDSQNVYRRARSIFDFDDQDNSVGQINPTTVGRLLAERFESGADLTQVRIYSGIPQNKYQPKGFAAVRRQTEAWRKSGLVEVVLRPLHYPEGWTPETNADEKPREKGIDVELAVDFVRLALSGHFDVGIIFSMDNDLKPPLEFIGQVHPEIGIGVASWWPTGAVSKLSRPSTISIPNINLREIRLNFEDFNSVRDDTNYSR